MITRKLTPLDALAIKAIMREAFGGFPWFEDLEEIELERRRQSYIVRPGFSGLVIEDKGSVVAAIWWDTPTVAELAKERGNELANWTHNFKFSRLVWSRDTVVSSRYQGQGLATSLRSEFLSSLDSETLVLTRLRNDNHGIIAISTKQGYQRTGIKVSSSMAGKFHEFWYKLV